MNATPTGADAMKEAERLILELSETGYLYGWDRALRLPAAHESSAANQAAAAALSAHIRKLVEAQPAAVAGEAVPDKPLQAYVKQHEFDDRKGYCIHCGHSRDFADGPDGIDCVSREDESAPAAPSVGEPPEFDHTAKCSPTLTMCPRCKNPHHACDTTFAASPAAPAGVPTQMDFKTTMKWATALADMTADRDEWRQQHENLLAVRQQDLAALTKPRSASPAAPLVGEPTKQPSCLCCGKEGTPKVWKIDAPAIYVCEACHRRATLPMPASLTTEEEGDAYMHGWFDGNASPAAPGGVNADDEHALTVAYMKGYSDGKAAGSVHPPACDSSEASGSAIPARPTLSDEQIIAIRQRVGGDGRTPWSDTLAFARALLAGGEQKAGSVHPSAAGAGNAGVRNAE